MQSGTPQLAELPEWPDGTVAVLATAGAEPHAIPVSTGVRAGPRTIVLALAQRRRSLARLRDDPRVALTLLGPDVACTAHGIATVVRDPMLAAAGVAAVCLEVSTIDDHRRPRFAMDAAVSWRWVDDAARQQDARIRDELRALRLPPL